ncbi:MAG: iron ABC transporter permease [Angelakisella sp.]|nr:iron ABC transporter permease [Angelakisella sp.]
MAIWRTSSTRRFPWTDRPVLLLCALGILLAALTALAVSLGPVQVPLSQLWGFLLGEEIPQSSWNILRHIRLPRAAAAVLTGAALAVSGAVLQAVLMNPLAGPNIIGVNAGSGFFVLAAALLFPGRWDVTPLAAFSGALLACGIIYALAAKTGASRITIVLAGVAVSGFFGAGSDAITVLVPDAWAGASAFLVGGFSGVTTGQLSFALWYVLGGLLSALLFSHDLNVLALGEETARSLGLPVKGCRFLFLAIAAVLAGGAVSMGGLLGFVGLIVPHAARFLMGEDNRLLLPAAALLGGAFVVGCDLLSRLLFAPYELPVGILLNFIGGPFFLWLLLKERRRRR